MNNMVFRFWLKEKVMSNRRKLRAPLPASFLNHPPGVICTYWNGEPCDAQKVNLVVSDPGIHPEYWARLFVGQVRPAVRVTYGGNTFYLDDLDGSGWRKVTVGFGSPQYGSRSLYGKEV